MRVIPDLLQVIVRAAYFLTQEPAFSLCSDDFAVALVERVGPLCDSLKVVEAIVADAVNVDVGSFEHPLNSHDFVLIGDRFRRHLRKFDLLVCARKLQVIRRSFLLLQCVLRLEFIQFVLFNLVLKEPFSVYISK